MKAVVCTQYGGPQMLKVVRTRKPVPKPHELLVKVHTAAVTRADAMMRSGTPWFARLFLGLRRPSKSIIGTCFSGTVEAVGSEVAGFAIGDAVFGETSINFGANAEFVAVGANEAILKKPDFLPFEEAATFCDGLLTSYNFLRQLGKLQQGQSVLINGASGSLGTAAVQLAKAFGAAEVVGVCSASNADLVKKLGATQVVDYRQTDFTKLSEKFDLVFDTIGGSSFPACKPILKENGQYLSPVLQLSLIWHMLATKPGKGKSAQFAATGLAPKGQLKAMLRELLNLYQQGAIHAPIEKSYTLEQVVEAHEHVDSGRKKGNIVLEVSSEKEVGEVMANRQGKSFSGL